MSAWKPVLGLVLLGGFLFAWSVGEAGPAQAFPTGQTQHSGSPDSGGSTCAQCHGGADGAASLSINGPIQVQAGSSVSYTVSIGGGPGAVGGFNAAFSGLAGTIAAADGSTRVAGDEITHSAPADFSAGNVSWQFSWTAPAEATTVQLYAAGVSGNANAMSTGDAVAASSLSIQVVAAPTATPTPTPGSAISVVTPQASATPTSVAADPSGSASGDPASDGAYGFGLNPVAATIEPEAAAGASPGLAATGRGSGASTLALALGTSGALFIVASRRSRPGP